MKDPVETIKSLMEPYLPPVDSRPQETDGDLVNLEDAEVAAIYAEVVRQFLAERANTNKASNTL
jgi:L-rhamnose isomerase